MAKKNPLLPQIPGFFKPLGGKSRRYLDTRTGQSVARRTVQDYQAQQIGYKDYADFTRRPERRVQARYGRIDVKGQDFHIDYARMSARDGVLVELFRQIKKQPNNRPLWLQFKGKKVSSYREDVRKQIITVNSLSFFKDDLLREIEDTGFDLMNFPMSGNRAVFDMLDRIDQVTLVWRD